MLLGWLSTGGAHRDSIRPVSGRSLVGLNISRTSEVGVEVQSTLLASSDTCRNNICREVGNILATIDEVRKISLRDRT